jgi:predicted anti-sigma-YlaC factor YlaD
MKCAEVKNLWEEYQKKKLPREQKEEVDRHLTDCKDCRDFYTSYNEIYAKSQGLANRPLPAGLWQGIAAELTTDRSTSPFWESLLVFPRYALATSAVALILFASLTVIKVDQHVARTQANDYLGQINDYLSSDSSWVNDENSL